MRLPVPLLALASAACAAPPVPDDTGLFRFAVFGDGPYYGIESGRFRIVLDQMVEREVSFLVHVGDILWYPCTAEAYRRRRDQLDALPFPVFYTPGDNEWTDCHEARPGRHEPLGRLAVLREVMFPQPDSSLGGRRVAVETQAADPAWAEFPEHARWRHDGVTFATLHIVSGQNGMDPFPDRGPAHDAEVVRRSAAAVAWIADTYAAAARDSAWAVVFAFHADPAFTEDPEYHQAYLPFVNAIARGAATFGKPVLIVHGDSHEFVADQPVRDPATGAVVTNVWRLETVGSPVIGWVEVIVDSTTVPPFRYTLRTQPRWRWW